jgi:hypothetical protein
MPLTAAQIQTLKTELTGGAADPYGLGYAPFAAVSDFGNLIQLLTFVRDGATPCPVNSVIGKTGNVTGATNATPVVITSTAHGLKTGDSVLIAGVGGNAAANGTFAITKIDANSFSLTGSVGNGAFTSGGTWTWCVTGVRQQFVDVQDICGAIDAADLITNNVATAATADQLGKLTLFAAICNDGRVALTNADGSDNNNSKNLKKVVANPSASRTAVNALATRTGSRIENLLGLSGVVPTEAEARAALS